MAPEMFGPYELQELIGRGGMGEVFRAFDTGRRRTVALKRLRPELVTDERFRTRFLRECLRAAQLTEAHIIPIHDYGEIDGRLYLDMRLIDGDTLADVLATDGPLSPERAVDVVTQVAEALDAAHAAGLVHRDVKPSNVLFSGEGSTPHCYLADFGIAGAVGGSGSGSLTATGATVGTIDYIAPERLLGRSVDRRADEYSLACLLHEALTGSPPFVADELPAMMHAHLNLEPPRASDLVPGVPRELDAVVARGMAKDPGARYQSAGELAEAARAGLNSPATTSAAGAAPTTTSLPVAPSSAFEAAAQVPARTPPRPHRRRRRLGARLLVLTILVLATGAAVGGVTLLNTVNATPVRAEPADVPGDNPFTPAPKSGAAGGSPPPPTDGGASGGTPTTDGSVSGDAPGLYGGTLTNVCAPDGIATFLESHPAKAAAWARVQGIEPTGIRSFLATLTPVTLRTDTAVTNHGFENGRATPFQSVMQAGTAVLVDQRGVPRVRCYCGNPLAPPAPRPSARYEGTQWKGFSPQSVTKIQPAAAPRPDFVLKGPGTVEVIVRPAGTIGDQDRPAPPEVAEQARQPTIGGNVDPSSRATPTSKSAAHSSRTTAHSAGNEGGTSSGTSTSSGGTSTLSGDRRSRHPNPSDSPVSAADERSGAGRSGEVPSSQSPPLEQAPPIESPSETGPPTVVVPREAPPSGQPPPSRQEPPPAQAPPSQQEPPPAQAPPSQQEPLPQQPPPLDKPPPPAGTTAPGTAPAPTQTPVQGGASTLQTPPG
jgi:serine/threonine protein kinase